MKYEIKIELASGEVKEMQTTAKSKRDAICTAKMYLRMNKAEGRIASVKEV